MNNLAPRQGLFAIILLVSFCLHVVILMFSTEKQQYDYHTDKGEKIVAQLGKEAMVALANQDRISLSVLANRYQVDNDVARLVISDPNNQALVQTGQSQTQAGQVIDQPIIQNNQLLGHATVTMRAISKGEIISNQWLYLLGSAIVHIFLWMIYGYVARPTTKQLEEIGERVQQRLAIARSAVPTDNQTLHQSDTSHTFNTDTDDTPKKSIQDFLQPNTKQADSNRSAIPAVPTMPTVEPNTNINTAVPPLTQPEQLIELQIQFFDEFHLFGRIAPEIAKPYLQLCDELLNRACDSLFNSNTSVINRYIKDVRIDNIGNFNGHRAVVQLTGKTEQLPLAAVLLGKLVIILNQVVYEKHREISRFSLPLTIGVSLDKQFDDTYRLLNNHAKQDGLLLLLPKPLLKTLEGQVQLKNLPHPTNITEREVAIYGGLAETLMAELIRKRDEILKDK